MIYFFLLVIFPLFFYTLILNRKKWAVAFYFALIAIIYFSGVELLSRPKPVLLEMIQTEEARLISSFFVEGEAIYVWVLYDEPRAYVLPWSDKRAKQIRQAMQAPQGAIIRLPFNRSNFADFTVHPLPIPMLPPKQDE